ncbi:hypothetical protein [Thermococcus sp.]|uniref:hypothetical protein n=1 Tax=Thermococcus sp. TaxID=35749 RepID=UPI00198DFC3D|nr:hypothetical protein [Thermococcus sp.]MBC7095454.1 hypothetical protein [Thermococcus sp.]
MWRKALALGLVLMALGVVVGGAVEEESLLIWKVTNSENMGAAAMGASGAIIAAAISKAGLAGLMLLGATVGGIIAAVGIGL